MMTETVKVEAKKKISYATQAIDANKLENSFVTDKSGLVKLIALIGGTYAAIILSVFLIIFLCCCCFTLMAIIA